MNQHSANITDHTRLQQLQYHHDFILSTDRKSLRTQIKSFVQKAQKNVNEKLQQRRQALQKLLENENRMHEEEFSNKIKSVLDEKIKQRRDTLIKIKEQNTKKEQEFVDSKRIQQQMINCYEVREALRHQQLQNDKECQKEQILERVRLVQKQHEMANNWQKVQQKAMAEANKRQQEEDNLKKAMVKSVNDALLFQIEELQAKKETVNQEKLEEKQKLDALLEEIRLENFDRKLQGKSSKVLGYREELLKMMTEKRMLREKQQSEEAEVHRKKLTEIKCIDAKEQAALLAKKQELYKAKTDFVNYNKRMRELAQEQERMYDARILDLHQMDACTKHKRQQKASEAQEYYADLRKQISEQQERRLQEQLQERECKILENKFVHIEKTRDQILERRLAHRKDLDKQIAENKRVQEQEGPKLKSYLSKSPDDSEFCSKLAEKCIREGVDYLEPHANWRLVNAANKPSGTKPIFHKDNFLEKHKKSSNFIQDSVSVYDEFTKQSCAFKSCDGRGDENL